MLGRAHVDRLNRDLPFAIAQFSIFKPGRMTNKGKGSVERLRVISAKNINSRCRDLFIDKKISGQSYRSSTGSNPFTL